MIVNRIGVSVVAAMACGWCVMTMTGCKAAAPPPQERYDYSVTLDKYYEGRPMCLWQEAVKFPIQATAEKINQLGLAGLANAGLLVAKSAGRGAKSFDLTPEGRSALFLDVFTPGAGNFCYGRRKVVSIDGARRNSSTTELVDYHYGVVEPAAWAKELSIESTFPEVAAELAGPHAGEATLLDTTGGWEISGAPAAIGLPATHPHASALAKAKSLLHLRKSEDQHAAL
jgi:hypothetical protein